MLAGLIPASVKGAKNEDLPLDSLVWVPVAQEEGTAACYQGNQHQRPSHRTRHDGHRETCVRDGGRASEMEWRLLCQFAIPHIRSGNTAVLSHTATYALIQSEQQTERYLITSTASDSLEVTSNTAESLLSPSTPRDIAATDTS